MRLRVGESRGVGEAARWKASDEPDPGEALLA